MAVGSMCTITKLCKANNQSNGAILHLYNRCPMLNFFLKCIFKKWLSKMDLMTGMKLVFRLRLNML